MALTTEPRTRAANASRQLDLIKAAIETISHHGLSKLTLAKVAAQAGLTAASVNFHFDSKEALLLATLRHVSDEFGHAIETACGSHQDPGSALLELIDVMLDSDVSDAAKVAVWYAFVSESQSRADYQKVCGDTDRRYDQAVTKLFTRLLETCGDRPIDAEAVARGFVGLLEGEWQEILFSEEQYDRTAGRRRCRAYLASLFPTRFEMPPAEATSGSLDLRDGTASSLSIPMTTLPAWTYDSPEFHALEREHLFSKAWQFVGHENDLPKPGDYTTFDLLGERAVIVRGSDHEIRAFHNVCRHRAHALVEGEGHCSRALTCPYHGWTYELDGRLRAIPDPDTFSNFDRSGYGLRSIDLEIFMGFVFVRFESDWSSVEKRLAPYAAELSAYRFEEVRALGPSWHLDVDVDWKNLMDNYLEDYHFKTSHPGLSALMESRYDREVSPTGVSRLSHHMKDDLQKSWSVRHYQKLVPDSEHLPADLRRRWSYFTMFPATSFELTAESVDVFNVLPLGPGRCRMQGRIYGLPDDSRRTRAARYLSARINNHVQLEDNDLIASVQRGLRSSGYRVGILSEKEIVVAGFQNFIREQIPAAKFETPPDFHRSMRQSG